MAILNDWAATGTASYVPFIGASCIKRCRLLVGTEVLMDYEFPQVFQWMLSETGDSVSTTRLLTAAGGAAPSSVGTALPSLGTFIPTPFSKILKLPALLTHKIHRPIVLEVQYRTATDCVLSGGTGAAISNSQLICWTGIPGDVMANYQKNSTIISKSVAFTTTTTQNVTKDIRVDVDVTSMTGVLMGMYMVSNLSASIANPPLDYFGGQQVISNCELITNGTTNDIFLSVAESIMSQFLYTHGASQVDVANYGHGVMIPLHVVMGEHLDTLQHFTGGSNSDKVSSRKLRIISDAAADVDVAICGLLHALYTYSNGGVKQKT